MRSCALLVALLLLLPSGPAAAEGPDDGGASAEAEREEEARGLYVLGQAAYSADRYDDAVLHFEAAYRLLPKPGFLFNAGRAHARLGRNREAAAAFRRYLAEAPTASDRDTVLQLIQALEAPPPPPRPRPRAASARPLSRRWWPWTLGGVAAGLALGLGLGLGLGLPRGGFAPTLGKIGPGAP